MDHTTATVTATHNETGQQHTVDLEGLTLSDLCDQLRELFPSQGVEEAADDMHADPEDIPARVTLNPDGFAAHLFVDGEPVPNFNDILKAWSDEGDDDRREAMSDYLDDGNDDLSDFDEAYQGQYTSGAAFAEEHCEGCGVIPRDFPAWVCIDWDRTWEANLRHDYWISDAGHVFRRL